MSIASKNLYELLGNDADQDPELRQPEPPTKAIDKTAARTGKRNAPAEAPSRAPAASSARTGGRSQRDPNNANESAFRDRGVGADKNRSRGSGEPRARGDYDSGSRGRGRGGRGRGGAGGDRHSRTGIADHEKQAAHGWGGQDGNAEYADEKAGEAIAQQDEKEGVIAEGEAEGADGEAAEAEEDKTKSYVDYLAEQAANKLSLAASNVRKPNEGSKQKFPEGKALSREEEDDFISGQGGKAKRTRERKEKATVELDDSRFLAQQRDTSFGGRGGRGRGGDRGGRGRGEFRGRGRGEGRGDGNRGRGGRGGQSGGPNVNDSSAFPSLGA